MFELHPFPPFPAPSVSLETVPLRANMPVPVSRFFMRIMGNQVPVIYSAVISGTGKLRFKGINFQARWRFVHCAGLSYRHYIEAALLGVPLIRVNESYLDGEARFELPFAVLKDNLKLNMSANLTLWAESVWLPSIWLTDPCVRWESLDETHATLIVPFGEREDGFTVCFDPQTGFLIRLETMRYRQASDEKKLGWRNDIQGWKQCHGIEVPSAATVSWADEASPWLTLSVDEVIYNADVTKYLHTNGV